MKWYRSVKILVGFVLATSLAMVANLDFPISAGIIAILNLMDTKKSSVRVAVRRFLAAGVGLMSLYLIYEIMGYEISSLFLFVAIFTPLAFKFKAREGLIVNIVLGSHLLAYHQATISHFLNEMSIVSLGVIVSLFISFHVPKKERLIKEAIIVIDDLIQKNIMALSMSIKNLCHIDEDDFDLDMLISKIKAARKLASEQMDNYYTRDYSFYFEFFQLRLDQAYRIKYMKERLGVSFVNQSQARILGDFTYKLATVFNPNNDGEALMVELNQIKETLSNLPLPETRQDFIEQSALNEYLRDLEEFIQMKIRYVESNRSQVI